MNKQRQQLQEHVEFDSAASLLNSLPVVASDPKSDFEQLLGHPAILPDRTAEIPIAEPVKYPAENSVFTSITQYAPEPKPEQKQSGAGRLVVCTYCGCPECVYSRWVVDD